MWASSVRSSTSEIKMSLLASTGGKSKLAAELFIYERRYCIVGKLKNWLLFVFPRNKIIVMIVSPVLLYGGLAES
jgi:hypothetical protein